MKKVLIRLCVVLFVVGIIFMNEYHIFADGNSLGAGYNPDLVKPIGGDPIETKVTDIAKAIANIIRILTVAAVAIVGMKYMLADSQGRSKIKDNLIWILGGVLLVTSATVIIDKVADAASSALV